MRSKKEKGKGAVDGTRCVYASGCLRNVLLAYLPMLLCLEVRTWVSGAA